MVLMCAYKIKKLGLNPITVTSRPPLEIEVGRKIYLIFLKKILNIFTLQQKIKL